MRASDNAGYVRGIVFVKERVLVELARTFVVARLGPRKVQRMPHGLTAERAYRVQAATFAILGEAVSGYKIGLTTPSAQMAMKWGQPIAGRLRARNLLRAPVRIAAAGSGRFAEVELVFEIGEDLDAADAPFAEADIARSIAGLYAGIEICASRYAHDDLTIFELIADNANADQLVIGDQLSSAWDVRFADLPVMLEREREASVRGSTASVLGNPLKSVVWLANWLAERGESLKAGQFVASGSCTGFTELHEPETLIARFGDIGVASVTIVATDPKGR